jgi:SAM-dependent MidA family methyltransferase
MPALELAGYTSQASFLLNSGMTELLMRTPTDAAAYLPQANAVQRLVSPAEMGELFKVIGLEGRQRAAGRICARGSAAFSFKPSLRQREAIRC